MPTKPDRKTPGTRVRSVRPAKTSKEITKELRGQHDLDPVQSEMEGCFTPLAVLFRS